MDGLRIDISDSPFSIGRAEGRSLQLPDSFISGLHAQIETGATGMHIFVDQRSTNGSLVDGRRVNAPVVLRDGALIRLGEQQFVYRNPLLNSEDVEGGLSTERTRLQTFSGSCWLLLLDLAGFSTARQRLGPAVSDAWMREWVEDVRQAVERWDGHLNSQIGDALLCYWRIDQSEGIMRRVAGLIPELRALQNSWRLRLRFRAVVHYGDANLSSSATRAENLTGAEVDFLFRMEKVAKDLGQDLMFSEAARLAWVDSQALKEAGRVGVAGFSGEYVFYALSEASPG